MEKILQCRYCKKGDLKMLILASMSPRRREILALAGFEFTVHPADIDESVPDGTPADSAVMMTAQKKAEAVLPYASEEDVILAADTVVCLDGVIIGKPATTDEAVKTLRTLSDRTHTVYTGYCLLKGGKRISGVEATNVTFRELDGNEIADYVASGEPMDKAGAYGLQGRGCTFAKRIDGEYFNVIGLPICTIHNCLKNI
jgi:septum formation protein maf